ILPTHLLFPEVRINDRNESLRSALLGRIRLTFGDQPRGLFSRRQHRRVTHWIKSDDILAGSFSLLPYGPHDIMFFRIILMKVKLINTTAIRDHLNRSLKQDGRPPVKDLEWQHAQSEHWVEDVARDQMTLSELIINIVEHRKWSGSDREIGRKKLDRGLPRARSLAVSAILAQDARRRRAVVRFRKD